MIARVKMREPNTIDNVSHSNISIGHKHMHKQPLLVTDLQKHASIIPKKVKPMQIKKKVIIPIGGPKINTTSEVNMRVHQPKSGEVIRPQISHTFVEHPYLCVQPPRMPQLKHHLWLQSGQET